MTQRAITLYGKLADVLGAQVLVDGGDSREPVAAIRARLAAFDSRLADLLADRRVRACVAGTKAADDMEVGPGQGVEFIPVVSGG